MKGIMFNLLEGFVTEKAGPEIWGGILSDCNLHTTEPSIMVGPGTYPDTDFAEMIQKSADHLKTTPRELLVDLGKYTLPKLAMRYPNFFTPYKHPRDFLKFTGMIHQTEVKKLYKHAETPHFSCHEISEDHIVLKYASKRHYGHMVEGLLHGLGTYYDVPLTVEMVLNKKESDNSSLCEFDLHFGEA